MSNRYSFYSDKGLEVKDNGKDILIEGFVTTGDRDLVGDIVSKECMADMLLQMSSGNIKVDMEHEAFRGKDKLDKELNKTINPVARIVAAEMNEKGILIKATMNRHNRRFEEAKGSIEGKFLDAFSIAYIPVKTAQISDRLGVQSRLLDKVNLLNVALTGNPVNTEARMTNVMLKSLEAMKEVEDEVKQMADDKIDKDKVEAKSVADIAKDLKSIRETVEGFDKRLKEVETKAETETTDTDTPTTSDDKTKDETKAGKYIGGQDGGKKKSTKQEEDEEDEEEKRRHMNKKGETKDEEKSELEKVKKEVEDLKAIINQPQYKATVEEMREALGKKGDAEKPKGPLDIIS